MVNNIEVTLGSLDITEIISKEWCLIVFWVNCDIIMHGLE